MTARQGDAPKGLTTFGLSFQWASFSKQLQGSDTVDSSGTERLDATLFDLSVWRHFKGGLAAGMQLPIGTVMVEPMGGERANVSGFGDLQLGGSYTFNGPWGGAFKPRIRTRATLVLPTGSARRVEDTSPGVPPNLIAIGTGAIGLGGDATITQPIAEKFSARAWLGLRAPLTFSETGNRFGLSGTAGVGAIYQPKAKVLFSASLSALHREKTRNRESGDLINSGGQVFGGDLGFSYLATDNVALGVSAGLPLYQNVNGVQIGQSFSVATFVGISFAKTGEDEHEHGGDEHKHNADEHKHGADEHKDDEHKNGADDHKHGAGEHENGKYNDEHKHGADGHKNGADGHKNGADGHKNGADGHKNGADEHKNGKHNDGHKHGADEHKSDKHKHGAEAQTPTKRKPKPRKITPDVAVLASGGNTFALSKAAVPGKLVAIDFWADWCGPCKEIEAVLRAHAAETADFAVRKVETPSPRSKVARDHLGGKVKLPTVWLVDKSGKVVEKLEGVTESQLKQALKRHR